MKNSKTLFNYKDIIIITIAIAFALIYSVAFSYYFTEKNKLITTNYNNYEVKIETVSYENAAAIPTGFPSTETRNNSFNSSVSITVPTTEGTVYGSGTIISDDGEYCYVLTCYHVIYQMLSTINLTFYDGTTAQAQLVGADPKTDIAVLKFLGTDYKTAALIADEASISAGQSVYAIGYSLGLYPFTYTFGSLSQKSERTVTVKDFGTYNLLQTDTAINSGMSGGGLFNSDGKLIGIVSAGYDSESAQNINFAIPSYVALNIARQLLTNKDATSGLGYVAGNYNLDLTIGTFGSSTTYPVVKEIPTHSSFYGTNSATSLMLYDMLKSIKIGSDPVIPLSTSTDMIQIFNEAENRITVGTQIKFVACENYGINNIERDVVITVKQYVFVPSKI